MAEPIIDAWIQHPTGKFIGHDMFASLRRWMKLEVIPEEIPVELTLAALDAAGVHKALASAWWGPEGPLLSNDDVARTVSAHPDRFAGVGSVNLHRPMDAVRELRRCVNELGFVAVRQLPWLWGQRKVLFGSNFPMIQPAKCIAQLDSLGLPDETRRAFLYENAQRVFRLET